MRLPLLLRVIIAIILGIVAGQFLPMGGVRLFATFNSVFGQFLSFIVPLIIVGLVTPAISDIGKGAGKLRYGYCRTAGIRRGRGSVPKYRGVGGQRAGGQRGVDRTFL